jgi:drug/metabolite transporter (DMT)-like permease
VLTAIAIITSLNPLVTVVMAYLILKEKIQRFEIGVLFFSVIAIIAFSITGED